MTCADVFLLSEDRLSLAGALAESSMFRCNVVSLTDLSANSFPVIPVYPVIYIKIISASLRTYAVSVLLLLFLVMLFRRGSEDRESDAVRQRGCWSDEEIFTAWFTAASSTSDGGY